MKRVAVVTDSTSCITKEMAEEYGIKIVYFHVYLDDKHYVDMVELTPSKFYQWQKETKKLAKTSAGVIADYLGAYKEATIGVEAILCISISTGFTDAYGRAVGAKNEFTQVPVEVYDTKTTGGAQGFITLAAAQAANEGKVLAEVIETAEQMKKKVNTLVLVDTLEFLAKGGRIGRAQALLGGMLNVKPLLEISTESGMMEALGRARGRPKAIGQLVNTMKERVGSAPVHIWINHGAMAEEAEKLKETISSQFNCRELYLTGLTPVMGAYTGPAIFLTFYSEA
jgi:DegV family protein with EDD domain